MLSTDHRSPVARRPLLPLATPLFPTLPPNATGASFIRHGLGQRHSTASNTKPMAIVQHCWNMPEAKYLWPKVDQVYKCKVLARPFEALSAASNAPTTGYHCPPSRQLPGSLTPSARSALTRTMNLLRFTTSLLCTMNCQVQPF
jgi:hypothetical protein